MNTYRLSIKKQGKYLFLNSQINSKTASDLPLYPAIMIGARLNVSVRSGRRFFACPRVSSALFNIARLSSCRKGIFNFIAFQSFSSMTWALLFFGCKFERSF